MIDRSEHEISKRYPHHTNIERFFDYLRAQLKNPEHLDDEDVRDEWVRELEHQNADTGTERYEIHSRYCADGAPHQYDYRTEFVSDAKDPESGSGTMHFFH